MQELEAELSHRQFVDDLFDLHFPDMGVNGPPTVSNYDCLRLMVTGVEEMCGDWSAYSLKYVRRLATACDTMEAEQMAQLYTNVGLHCGAF